MSKSIKCYELRYPVNGSCQDSYVRVLPDLGVKYYPHTPKLARNSTTEYFSYAQARTVQTMNIILIISTAATPRPKLKNHASRYEFKCVQVLSTEITVSVAQGSQPFDKTFVRIMAFRSAKAGQSNLQLLSLEIRIQNKLLPNHSSIS